MPSSPRDFGARFWALIAATYLGFLGMGTVLPALAPHVRHDLGGSDRTVGFVIGVFSFVALGGRFFSGPLADNRGRKVAFLTGLVSCCLSGIAYLLPFGLAGAYLGRMLQGFGEACLYTGAAAWAVELGGVERSSQALGYVSTGIWGGISCGPVVGQWLITFEREAIMQSVCAVAAFLLLLNIPEAYRPTPHETKPHWFPKIYIKPGFAIGFVNVHYPVITGFLVLHLAKSGNAGPYAFSAYAGAILLSRFFLGSLPDRIAPGITYYFGLSAMALGLIVIALQPNAVVAVLAAALLGFGFSFPWSSVASTVLRQVPAREHGTAVGVLSAFYDLFVGAGSFAAGAISDRFGYSAAFYMAAAALLAAAFAGSLVFRPTRAVEAAAAP